jgi:hypothetical protein
MAKIYEISATVAEILKGKKYNDHVYFNPVQDDKDKWFITDIQIDGNTKDELKVYLQGLVEKPKTEYKPKEYK